MADAPTSCPRCRADRGVTRHDGEVWWTCKGCGQPIVPVESEVMGGEEPVTGRGGTLPPMDESPQNPPQVGGVRPAVTNDPLVVFFYGLLRDGPLTPGEIEAKVLEIEQTALRIRRESDPVYYLTNPHLAGYAENIAARLATENLVTARLAAPPPPQDPGMPTT